MRRFILISLVSLVVLFAATIGVGWYLLQDEAFLKTQASKLTLKYTGRVLTFKGPLNLQPGSITSLEARDVHFSNPDWADHPEMVSAGHILISFELTSLFEEPLTFPNIVLEDCRVFLERTDDGEANWSMGPEPEPETLPAPKPDETAPPKWPIWVKDLAIRNCELDVTSFKFERPLALKLSDLTMQHHDDNRWSGKGSGSLNNMPLSLDGWFAPFSSIIYGGPLNHELKFSLGEISLNSSGGVKDVQTGTGANLSARLAGPRIEEILNEFKLPLFTEGAFDFTTNLNTEGDMTKLDIDGDMGSLVANVDGELDRLIRPTRGNVKLSVDGPNLGALANILGIEGLVEEEFNHESHASFDGDRIHIKKTRLKTPKDHLELGGHFSMAPHFAGTELDIKFQTSEAGRWTAAIGKEAQTLGAFSLNSKLSVGPQGMLAIEGNAVQAETTLDFDGTLGSLADGFNPNLKISLESPNPRPLASVWGFTDIPAEPLAIQGRFGLQGKRLEFEKVDIRLAASDAKADGTLNLDNRFAGSDIVLDINIANAEKLGLLFGREGLPNQPLHLDAEIKPDGKGLAFKVKDGNLGKIQLELEGRILDLQHPMVIDGNFDINLPRLGDLSFLIPGTELPDAPFTANGQLVTEENKVNLHKVHVDLAGNRATIDGHINLGKRYAGSKLTFDLDIKNVQQLGMLFKQDGFPNQPLKLSASVEPVGKGMAFKLNDGKLGRIQLELDGKIADMDQPTGVDAQFNIKLPRLRDIAFLIPGRDLPEIPFAASGRLVNEKSKTHLDQVQLSLGGIRASVDGDVHPDNSFQLAIRAAGPDASKLDKLAGTPLPANPFSVTTGLKGNASEFELQKLDLILGESQVSGNLKIGLGDITMLKGSINASHLDVSHWYPGDQAEQEPEPTPASSKKEWMFDDTPVMVLDDHKLDLDLDLKIDTLFTGNATYKSIVVDFELTRGLMKISPFTFKGTEGGSYNGNFSLDGRSGTPALRLDVSGKDVRVGIAALPGQDPQTYPPLEVEANLEGAGRTRRELVSSLNGKYVSYLGKGQLASAGMDLLFSDFFTQLFTQLDPFRETSQYTNLDCAVMAAKAESGLIRVFPVIVQSEKMTILSEGTVDMNTEIIDLSFNTKPRTGIGLSPGMIINPLIKVGGRLTAPAVEADPEGTLKTGGLAVATIGISLLAKSFSDRFLSSPDPCGDARKAIEESETGNQ